MRQDITVWVTFVIHVIGKNFAKNMACFLSMAQQGLKQWEKAFPIGCDDFAQPQIENRLCKVQSAPVQH